MSPLEELEQRFHEVEFGAATCALTILRFMTDAVSSLPMSVLARLVSTHDTIMALLPLVEKPPWVRTRKGKVRGQTATGGLELGTGKRQWVPVYRGNNCRMPTPAIHRFFWQSMGATWYEGMVLGPGKDLCNRVWAL